MGITTTDLEIAIRAAFPIIHLEIEDTSSGCGENYSVFIVSTVSHSEIPVTQQRGLGQLKCFTTFQAFEGKTTLARHRLGNAVVR